MFLQLLNFQPRTFTPAVGSNAGNEKYLKRPHQPRVRGKIPALHRVSRRARYGILEHGKNGARAPPK